MKKQAFISITAFLLVCIFWSCDDNTTNGSSQGTKLSRGLDGLFADQIQQATQKFTINADRLPATVTGKYGTTLTFRSLWNRFNARPASGNVQVEFIEIYTVADMLLMNKPTLSNIGGKDIPLESGGEFFVSAQQDGSPLIMSYNLTSPPQKTLVSDMMGFAGQSVSTRLDSTRIDSTRSAPVVWTQITSRNITCIDTGGARVGTYCLNFQNGNWCNIDRFIATDSTKPLIVKIPAGLMPPNVVVYITVVNATSLVPLSLFQNGTFTATYGLKLGTEINILVVADDKGTLKYAIQRTKITNNQTETISTLTPITVDELRSKILAL